VTIHATAQAIARELGDWRHAPRERAYEHIAYLRHEDTGAEVSLYAPHYPPGAKDKLEVKGVYPSPWGDGGTADPSYWGVVPYGSHGPRIHVTATRSPEAIAAEFRRRFEPEFWPVWHAVQAKHTERLIEVDAADRLAEDLARLAPRGWVVPSRHRRNEAQVSLRHLEEERWYGRAEVYRSGKTHLELRDLTPDEARSVVAALSRGA
jgi:hypothetical protein